MVRVAFVFETWGYLHGDPSNALSDTYGAMQRRLHAGYAKLARAADAIVAPVGDIWQAAVSQQPHLGLWAPDGKHPSRFGSYLTASVFHGLLEDMHPLDTEYTAGLGDVPTEHLRSETDLQLSKTWRLRDIKQPGITMTAELRNPAQAPLKPHLQHP